MLFGQTNGDARADVYSLAATLWQLLVGRSPFEVPGGDNTAYALMPRIRSSPVPTTGRADVPVSLERLLSLAMAKDPAARPASALAFARALQEIEQEQRFPRTAMVVLDEQGQTTLADHSGPRPEDADEDRTRVRSPKAVQAQGPAPARPAPAAYQSRLSGSTTIPSASAAPVTTHHGRPGLAAAHDDAAEEGTVRVDRSRARQASGATEEPTSQETRPQAQISPAVTIGVVAGLVVALVGVGAWALAGRGDTPEPAPTTAAPTVAGPTDDLLSIPQTPAVEARAVAGGVRFGWTYAGRREGGHLPGEGGPGRGCPRRGEVPGGQGADPHRQDQQGAAAVRPGAGRAQRHELGLVRARVREGGVAAWASRWSSAASSSSPTPNGP